MKNGSKYNVICPYCGSEATLRDTTMIYGKSYGNAYVCNNYPKCDSFVGVHRNSNKPLGTLANKRLRELRRMAHYYFNFLYIHRYRVTKKKDSRARGYLWLSKTLGLHPKDTHIGMFDEDMCIKVIKLCKPIRDKIQQSYVNRR